MNPSHTTLASLAAQFVQHKRNMGIKYKTGAVYLCSLLNYARLHFPNEDVLSKALITGWCSASALNPGSLYNKSAVAREFGKYLAINGNADAYVLPRKRRPKLDRHMPYFFEQGEITVFFSNCKRTPARKELPGRELVLPAIFHFMYCCGVRCAEVLSLRCVDVHLEKRTIDIVESKGRSRRIFISDSLAVMFKEYDRRIALLYPKRKFFFPKNQMEPYGSAFIRSNFNRIWRESFPDFQSSIKPRAYDFRNHFAYANRFFLKSEGKLLDSRGGV
jgi:integrase